MGNVVLPQTPANPHSHTCSGGPETLHVRTTLRVETLRLRPGPVYQYQSTLTVTVQGTRDGDPGGFWTVSGVGVTDTRLFLGEGKGDGGWVKNTVVVPESPFHPYSDY